MDGPIDDFRPAFAIYRTVGIHAHALKTAALRNEIRTKAGDGQAVLYHVEDARRWAESRPPEERSRFAATVRRYSPGTVLGPHAMAS